MWCLAFFSRQPLGLASKPLSSNTSTSELNLPPAILRVCLTYLAQIHFGSMLMVTTIFSNMSLLTGTHTLGWEVVNLTVWISSDPGADTATTTAFSQQIRPGCQQVRLCNYCMTLAIGASDEQGFEKPQGFQTRVWGVGVRVWIFRPSKTPTPHQGYRGLRSPVVKKIIHYFFGECLVWVV